MKALKIFCLLIIIACSQTACSANSWPFEIDAQHRPGAYWWAPGSAYDKDSIDWNLENFRAGGFGNVHIIPIYGAKGYEDRYIDYLSPKWMEMLDYIVKRADKLGINVDMTTGTGWCFGGPDLPREYIDTTVRWDENKKSFSLGGGMKVKRPAPGGSGAMLNSFSAEAMEYYLKRFSKAFDSYKPGMPRAQYHDSYEYRGDWSADLLGQFKKRRGYDLEPYLETFFGKTTDENRDLKTRLKYDYRLTLAEGHLEYIQAWSKWARQRGMITRDQAHGSPANLLDVYAAADIPETEMFGAPEFEVPGFRRDPQFCREGDSNPLILKMASSAANVAHKPGSQLVSSESFTWLREHWHGTLGQMKMSTDLFFLSGINHIFYHGSCYSPKDAPWPGWFFYASTKADWRNSIWHDIGFLNEYMARCQSMLQNTMPANDLLVYWPIHDLWMNPDGMQNKLVVHNSRWINDQPLGKLSRKLIAGGYTFDFISDAMLKKLSVKDGAIHAPGGKYRAVVIPESEYMPAMTAGALIKLAAAGADVIFDKTLPGDVPGMSDIENQRKTFADAKGKLQRSVIASMDMYISLSDKGIFPESMVTHGLQFIRRRSGDTYWYFIANHSAEAVDGWVSLAVPFKKAVEYDPMTGKSCRLSVRQSKESRQVYMQLAAGASTIVCCGSSVPDMLKREYLKAADTAVTLTGTWDVEFIDGDPKLPKGYKTNKLECWAKSADPAAVEFAGTARYTLKFDMPDVEADQWVLDLGDVRESARIKVNGRDAGCVFAIPFTVKVGQYLRPGENTLEIEVTNLTANRLRAFDKENSDWKIMSDINIVNVNYKKFEPASWPISPSGLLGPVKLVGMKFVKF